MDFSKGLLRLVSELTQHASFPADEFERARKPNLEGLAKSEETNGYWAGSLAGVQTDERRLKLIRDAKPGLEKVTQADVQRVAKKYLTEERAWRLVVAPKQ